MQLWEDICKLNVDDALQSDWPESLFGMSSMRDKIVAVHDGENDIDKALADL